MQASGEDCEPRPFRPTFPREAGAPRSRACPSLRTRQPPKCREGRACSRRDASKERPATATYAVDGIRTRNRWCYVIRAFTTPQTLELHLVHNCEQNKNRKNRRSKDRPLHRCRLRTPVVLLHKHEFSSPMAARKKCREELTFTVLGIRTRALAGTVSKYP